ncbi:hypothetical protein BB559_003191 [Furculomyces boomerangus]|uniref:[histone H3]-trimethyl-L-lysine(4) demethylase n=1 Tax=Furculomyces boomerangus TaxID=61424 RepID=A0A2T9YMZ4_9FUNG|nr:hypothetical protein BB559_003191 [Furculomyces boomerangus]
MIRTAQSDQNYKSRKSTNLNRRTHVPRKNLFELPEAAIFYPNDIEFEDPIGYIEKIKAEGEKYGICKIVPPSSWKPTFSLDVKNFRFPTRIQQLNALDGRNRIKKSYADQIAAYHEEKDQRPFKIPHLNKQPIDLSKLNQEVIARGGYDVVTVNKLWADIGRSLNYDVKACTSLSNTLKNVYLKIILPYEEDTQISKDSKNTRTRKSEKNNKDSQESDSDDDDFWLDYGFEDGESTYSLQEFQKKSNNFKKKTFSDFLNKNRNLSTSQIPPEEVETKFWQLVDSLDNDTFVEYGADLSSTIYGSGFPTSERNHSDKYSYNKWNLNNFPYLDKSLFNFLTEDINGMTSPWLYAGMCLSAFCWHNEDHYSYSVNYMHWGEPKTWYGIPGDQSDLFEHVMKKSLPELFEADPNILFHLVTMMSPKVLKENNVKVTIADQYPGEFIVTFPQSYHSGFNQGFNFNEAVNFITADWIKYGESSINHYKKYKRDPAFSHEELIHNIYKGYTESDSVTPEWLKNAVKKLVNGEIDTRKSFRSFLDTYKSRNHKTNISVNCSNCRKFCFYSYVKLESNDDNQDEIFCCDCFINSFTSKEITLLGEESAEFVLTITDLDLLTYLDVSCEYILKWATTFWNILAFENKYSVDFVDPLLSSMFSGSNYWKNHSMNQESIKENSKNLNSPIKVKISSKVNIHEASTNHNKIHLCFARTLLNYCSHLITNASTISLIKNQISTLRQFTGKANYLCMVTHSLLRLSGKSDVLKSIAKQSYDLGVLVYDPATLVASGSTGNPPLSKINIESNPILSQIQVMFSNIFKSVGEEKLLATSGFYGMVTFHKLDEKKIPGLNKYLDNSSEDSLNTNIQPNQNPSLEDNHEFGKTSSPRSARSRRVSSFLDKPESPYVSRWSGLRKSSQNSLEISTIEMPKKPETVYNFSTGKSKAEIVSIVNGFSKEIFGNQEASTFIKTSPPYPAELIDKLINEFEKLGVSCPELECLLSWRSEYKKFLASISVVLKCLLKHLLITSQELLDNNISLECQDVASDTHSQSMASSSEQTHPIPLEFDLSDYNLVIDQAVSLNLRSKVTDFLLDKKPIVDWYLNANSFVSKRELRYEDFDSLIQEATEFKIQPDHQVLLQLENIEKDTIKWDKEVESLLNLTSKPNLQLEPETKQRLIDTQNDELVENPTVESVMNTNTFENSKGITAYQSVPKKREALTLRKCGTLLDRGKNLRLVPRLYSTLENIQESMIKLQNDTDSMVERACLPHFPLRPGLKDALKIQSLIKSNEIEKGYIFVPNSFDQLEVFIEGVNVWLEKVNFSFFKLKTGNQLYEKLENVASKTKSTESLLTEMFSILSSDDGKLFPTEKKLLSFFNRISSTKSSRNSSYSKLPLTLGNEENENAQNAESRDGNNPISLICVCKKAATSSFICCENCGLKFHLDCVEITHDVPEIIHKSLCPICGTNTQFKHSTIRPSLSSLNMLIESGRKLNLVCPELDLLLNLALDTRTMVSTICSIISRLYLLSNSSEQDPGTPNSVKSNYLPPVILSAYRLCYMMLLGLEVDISKDTFPSFQQHGKYLIKSLRKLVKNKNNSDLPSNSSQSPIKLQGYNTPPSGKIKRSNKVLTSGEKNSGKKPRKSEEPVTKYKTDHHGNQLLEKQNINFDTGILGNNFLVNTKSNSSISTNPIFEENIPLSMYKSFNSLFMNNFQKDNTIKETPMAPQLNSNTRLETNIKPKHLEKTIKDKSKPIFISVSESDSDDQPLNLALSNRKQEQVTEKVGDSSLITTDFKKNTKELKNENLTKVVQRPSVKRYLSTTADLSRVYRERGILNFPEMCICQSTPSTDPNWNSPENYVLLCDYCHEFYHLSCVLVPVEQAEIITRSQKERNSRPEKNKELSALDIIRNPGVYMCPICAYSSNMKYRFGEIELDTS